MKNFLSNLPRPRISVTKSRNIFHSHDRSCKSFSLQISFCTDHLRNPTYRILSPIETAEHPPSPTESDPLLPDERKPPTEFSTAVEAPPKMEDFEVLPVNEDVDETPEEVTESELYSHDEVADEDADDGYYLDFLPEVLKHLDKFGLSEDDIYDIVENPNYTNSSDKFGHCRTSYHGDTYYVVVADDNDTVLHVAPNSSLNNGYTKSFTRDVPQRKLPGQKTKKANQFPRPDSVKQFIKQLEEHGFFVYLANGSHYKAEHQSFPGRSVFFANSPSDYRWYDNACKTFKKTFDIDVKSRPAT